MRTLIDLVDTQVEALDLVAKQEKRSRASVVRQAVDEFLARRSPAQPGEAFGIWRERNVDGIAYQRGLRDEW